MSITYKIKKFFKSWLNAKLRINQQLRKLEENLLKNYHFTTKLYCINTVWDTDQSGF